MRRRRWNPCARVAAVAVGLLSFLLISFFITAEATAQSSGNLCIKEKLGGEPSCVANDVRFAALDVISGPTGCKLGDTITVTVLATLESGPERYDIGIWVNESGGSALSDPDGTCYRDFLNPVSSDNSDCNQDGGPYYNAPAENDSCGDVPAVGNDPCGSLSGPCSDGGGTCIFTFRTITVDLVCADGDGNGLADAGWATSWDNHADNDCADELDTDPGTGSKCFAHDFVGLNGIEIFCTGIDPNTECCNPATGNISPIDDGLACTEDVCDVNTGNVTHTPDDGECDDGLYCNGAETCDPALGCQAGTNPCVPPLVCDEAGDACIGCLTDGDCDDGVGCTLDTCNAGNCVNTPDDSACDDGLYCDGTEVCDPIWGCQPGTDPCDDGNDCTDDVCTEAGQTCEYSCNATGYEDICCEDEACLGDPACKQPACGDDAIDPGEQCGEPGLEACPPESKFCVNCRCSPVAIDLIDFTATGMDGAVHIAWSTGSETDTNGFNILRSEEELGQYAKINANLIPHKGSPSQGASYSYTDSDVVNGTTYWYKLQEVEVLGAETEYGPVSATPTSGGYSAAANAEASTHGSGSLVGSGVFNELSLMLIPVGAVVLLRWLRRKK